MDEKAEETHTLINGHRQAAVDGDKTKRQDAVDSEKSLMTEGQRRINLMWERTQAFIAIVVVTITMFASGYGYIAGKTEVPILMGTMMGTVVGFYFGRTNHSRTGGAGKQPPEGQDR